ncbi:DUF1697 domain-containing protein [Patiriisocius hiemis]|uniref:DUF1697 domain-containing protein n=1 Tax=Patiriisocius hiemis TaxID=3075604 RepID=A0ABU2YDR2_9FLAO|nr:DUF1697 domain-containing protein [Constantimarinum sp. W242]MDT0556324.1 DUF1697 domain-containing protein [Constantimarinum sp. W242]
MVKYVALIRGINVGGHKRFLKTEQLDMLNQLGLNEPKVYLHTGNWLFKSEETKSVLSQKIIKAIQSKFGWEVPVLVLTISEVKIILENCPFTEEKKQKSYFVIFSETPAKHLAEEVNKISYPNEEIVIKDNCLYFYSSVGYGKTKFSMNSFEKKLQVNATSRNFNTLNKILDLSI